MNSFFPLCAVFPTFTFTAFTTANTGVYPRLLLSEDLYLNLLGIVQFGEDKPMEIRGSSGSLEGLYPDKAEL